MPNRKDRAADAVVIGAGVVGLCVARELGRRGLSVTLVERGEPGAEASAAAAGMLAPQAEADRDDTFFRLQCAGRDAYPAFAESLLAETGIDIELDRTGTLYLAFDEEDEEELERRRAWQERAGLPVERLNAREAHSLEPNISESARMALRFPLDWQVENRRTVEALVWALGNVGRSNVCLLAATEALGVRIEAGRVAGVETSRGYIAAGAVVVAAGAWASRLRLIVNGHGTEAGGISGGDISSPNVPRIEPVRGQMLCFQQGATFQPFVSHVVYTRRGYLVPRRDSRLLAGSTTERAGFNQFVTAAGAREILEHALEIAPALGSLQLADSWAGLRPAAEDERPVIGESEEARGLFYATGHYRNGILLAPLTGALVADLVANGAGSPLLEAFAPGRFSRAAV